MAAHEHFRALWVTSGYRSNMASAIAARPPPAGTLRVYHLTSADHAINDIAFGRLKVARFSDLNDPFELLSANFREQRVRNVMRDFKNAYDSVGNVHHRSEVGQGALPATRLRRDGENTHLGRPLIRS